jgi:hypothetical protein
MYSASVNANSTTIITRNQLKFQTKQNNNNKFICVCIPTSASGSKQATARSITPPSPQNDAANDGMPATIQQILSINKRYNNYSYNNNNKQIYHVLMIWHISLQHQFQSNNVEAVKRKTKTFQNISTETTTQNTSIKEANTRGPPAFLNAYYKNTSTKTHTYKRRQHNNKTQQNQNEPQPNQDRRQPNRARATTHKAFRKNRRAPHLHRVSVLQPNNCQKKIFSIHHHHLTYAT